MNADAADADPLEDNPNLVKQCIDEVREKLRLDEGATDFDTVLSAELDSIAARRVALSLAPHDKSGAQSGQSADAKPQLAAPKDKAWMMRLLGLSFSGGGIRSATFNLGVLQTLAQHHLLKHVDYVSTVSGGGYIGTWFAALSQRRFGKDGTEKFDPDAYKRFEQDLAWSAGGHTGGAGEEISEISAIGFLRRFSNYLTPRLGVLSGDTWALIALYLRNVILNQLVLILALVSVTLVVPRLLAAVSTSVGGVHDVVIRLLSSSLPFEYSSASGAQWTLIGVFLACCLVAAVNIGRNLAVADDARAQKKAPRDSGGGKANGSSKADAGNASIGVIVGMLLPLLIVGCTLPNWLPGISDHIDTTYPTSARGAHAYAAGIGAIGSLVAWTLIVVAWFIWTKLRSLQPAWGLWCVILLTSLISGAVFGIGMYWGGRFLEVLGYAGAQLVVAPALLAVGILTAGVLHVGLIGRILRAQYSEWLSRLGGLTLIGSIGWLLFSGLLLYSPLLIDMLQLSFTLVSGAGLAWFATTITGLFLGRSAQPAASSRATRWIRTVAPWIFIVGLIVLVAGNTQGPLHGVVLAVDAPVEPNAAPLPQAVAKAAYDNQLALFPSRAFGENGAVGDALAPVMDTYHAWLASTDRFWILLWSAVIVFVVCAILSQRVDINDFSLHNLYANRLTRCYLGASVEGRFGNPFSGFSANDDLTLAVKTTTKAGTAVLSHTKRKRSPTVPQDERQRAKLIVPKGAYPGPYPIINTAVNLVAGGNLAWQERKAASFILTPLYCGYDRRAVGQTDPEEGAAIDAYRPTTLYSSQPRPLTLGEAMATSGAAASPNMGYHSSPAFAFLMSIFNVRLGRWAGNPRVPRRRSWFSWLARFPGFGGLGGESFGRGKTWRKTGPWWALHYLFCELFGLTDSKSSFVYLSDGGHFENLGIYELVRRRCRYIIACDSGADPRYEFADLGNAIRKCRIDLGVEIEMDTKHIATIAADRFNQASCAIGRIRYGEECVGTLLYIKSSRCRGITSDVVNYGTQHLDFPHETTADQFFSESQFESYRRLGRHLSDLVLDAAVNDRESTESKGSYIDDVFQRLRRNWYPPSPAVAANFSRLTAACERIFEQLRQPNSSLEFLSDQFYPEWRSLISGSVSATEVEAAKPWDLPKGEKELAAGFYFCNSLIQLMENVYIDLNLESDWQHPDNSGWVNLFRHWSWSSMLRVTWAISAATYGERFRMFCRQRLDLSLGEVYIKSVASLQPVNGVRFENSGLNLHERWQLYRLLGDLDGDVRLYELRLRVETPVPTKPSKQTVGTLPETLRDFVFGYTLLRDRELVMFRVQDHLRRMTLGRRALTKLVKDEKDLYIDKSDTDVLKRLDGIKDASTLTRLNDFRGLVRTIQDDHL